MRPTTPQLSETGRIRFRRAQCQTSKSVSFLALTEFQGESSVRSSQPFIASKGELTEVFRRTHRVCCRTQCCLFRNSTPQQKTNTCRKSLGELIFARILAGPVFTLARIQENTFEELFSKYFAKCFGEVILLRIHAALVFAPELIQKNPGEFFMSKKNKGGGKLSGGETMP